MRSDVYTLQAEICKALSHPLRLRILDLLEEGELAHAQLCDALDIPKANLTQHMGVLRDAGVVTSRKEGLFLFYSLSFPEIKSACALIREVLLKKIKVEETAQSILKKELKRKIK